MFEIDQVISYNVTSTIVDGSYNATLTTSSAHNFAVGDSIIVASVGSPYNGTWTVTAIANSTSVSFIVDSAITPQVSVSTGTVSLASNNNLPIYAHPNPAWVWTGVCDGPNNIYMSGYAGDSSSVFRLVLDTSGAVPLLTRALTAADMPKGEIIYALGAYIGKYIVFCTNKGIRVGQIDTSGFYSNGYITYGPISVVTNGYDPASGTVLNGLPSYAVTFADRFAYCTVSNYIDNGDGTFSSGLVKIDLSRDLSINQMAYATHLRVPTTAVARAVCIVGKSGKLAIGVDATGVYFQANTLVSSGYLQTGQIRYFTLEDKHFELVKLRQTLPMQGEVGLSVVNSDGTVNGIITVGGDFDFTQDITGVDSQDTSPKESIGLKFTFTSAAGQLVGEEDSFNGYQLKALPAVKRERIITLPLLNYDFEGDRYNMTTGYEGRAIERLTALESVESDGDVVIMQDFTSGETLRGVIESLTFVRETPPERRFKGFGGIIMCQFRTI
jgi:hypothetical protein